MNSKLIAKGFINDIVVRKEHSFAKVAIFNGSKDSLKKHDEYSLLIDKDLANYFNDLEVMAQVENSTLINFLLKKPFVFNICNPSVDIKNGFISRSGILKFICPYDIYRSGLHEKDNF